MADSKLTDLTADTTPTLDDLTYTVNDPAGSPSDKKVTIAAILAICGYPCNGRLTTETGVPVSTSDRTGQGTLYFTPFNGNTVALYTSSAWKLYTFTEKSLSLTLTSGKAYDVFLYDNSGTLTLELSAAWTNDTTRADAIAQQDGVDVKSSDHSRRLVGTIYASGTNTTEDSLANRYVASRYNQVPRALYTCPKYTDDNATTSYTLTSGTWVAVNSGTGATASYVVSIPSNVHLGIVARVDVPAAGSVIGIGSDSTTQATACSSFANNLTETLQKSVQVSAGRHSATFLGASQTNGQTTTIYSDRSRGTGDAADPPLSWLNGLVTS